MNSGAPKRVVLCDDHEIVREAVKARMAATEGVEIVGEAETGEDVVGVVTELKPDVCDRRRRAAGQGRDRGDQGGPQGASPRPA